MPRRPIIAALVIASLVALTLLGVGQRQATADPEAPPTFVSQFGTTGTGNGQFRSPFGPAIDGLGNVYVVDYLNNRVQKFDADGTFITTWGTSGSGNGQFKFPRAVAVDDSNNIYVADSFNHRIQKFTSGGVFSLKWGTLGSGNGQFDAPHGVATDSAGNVYVADLVNQRIQKFNSTGGFITKWGSAGTGNGQFSLPISVAVDPTGNVYVVDRNNNRVQKFDSNGTFLAKWGTTGAGDGQFNKPWGVSVDADGNVYVADDNNNRVQKFSPEGAFLAKWGTAGSGPGQFDDPVGVAINPDTGRIYVADSGNDRIQVFEPASVPDDVGATATAAAEATASANATATAASADAAATAAANATATAVAATATAAAAQPGGATAPTPTPAPTSTPTPEPTAQPTPEPTPTPIPPYTGPIPAAPAMPDGVDVQEPVRPDLDVAAAITFGDEATDAASVKILAGSSAGFMFLRMTGIDRTEPPATEARRAIQERLEQVVEQLPPTLAIVGDRLFEITPVEPDGDPVTGPLSRPVTISFAYTDSDAAQAGSVFNLRILRYDSAIGAWAPLHTTIDFAGKRLTAQVTNLSVFAIGRVVAGGLVQPLQAGASAPGAAILPNTGGIAPGSGLLIGMLAAGIAFVLTGGAFLFRKSSRVPMRQEERSNRD